MQTTRQPFVLLFAAAVLLAACSSDADDGSATTEGPAPSTTEAQTVDPAPDEIAQEVLDRVAGDICSSIASWSTSISEAYDATPAALAEADDTEAARGVVIAWMATMSTHTEGLVGDLQAIDLEGAASLEPFLEDLAQRFENLNGIVEEHESQASAISTSAPETFRSEVSALVDEFNTALADLPSVFEDLNASYPSDDLQSALAGACELDPLDGGDDPESLEPVPDEAPTGQG